MSWPSKPIGLAIVGLSLAGSLAPAAPEKNDPNVALAREQLKVIERAFEDMDRLTSGGHLNLTNPKYTFWGQRKLDALRAAKVSKNEMIAALTEYLERMKKHETNVNRAHQAGNADLLDVRDAQYLRLEAEIWLNQEKAR
jgi:hypothetical protein